jgi:hypothetical protein
LLGLILSTIIVLGRKTPLAVLLVSTERKNISH